MEALINKTFKSYNYLSRYSSFPYYYNKNDDKYVQGLTSWLKETSTYVLHEVKENETLDSIALDNYSNSTFFWVIADYNKIRDPYKKLKVGEVLKIPTLSDIVFKTI